jgi:hypothetical protein
MNAEFPHHAAECGQPRKCVLQSPEYQRRGRYVSRKARAGGGRPLAFSYRRGLP